MLVQSSNGEQTPNSFKAATAASAATRTKSTHHAPRKMSHEHGSLVTSSSQTLDDGMDHEKLMELEQIFQEAMDDGADGLDMNQFRVAMKRAMGEHLDDNELDMIFMKSRIAQVDTNCDGTVDWSEYLTFMLLEYQEKENMFSMLQECPFPNPMQLVPSNHLESICRISRLTAYSRFGTNVSEVDENGSRYLTLSKEGALNVWSTDWTLQKSTSLDHLAGGGKSLWLTDMVCLSNSNSIAVSSTDYEISFYSLTSNLTQKKFQIKGLEHCALSMDYSFDPRQPKRGILLWGDTSGSVFVVRFYDNPSICLFASSKSGTATVASLRSGELVNVVAARFTNVHCGWVQQIRYFVSKKGQECFVSGCISDYRALQFADITPKVAGSLKDQHIAISRQSFFSIRKGVACLDYDPDWNLIVTGSRDCDVRIWNPYVVNKASAVLKGHTCAVVQVYVKPSDSHIISISKDKNIRVWDLKDYSCKQNIHGRNVGLGRLDVSAMYVNSRRKELVVATNQIGRFLPRNTMAAKLSGNVQSHQKAVSCVLYNPLFKQIVTGGDDGAVAVWDLKTGNKSMQFYTERNVEISTMAFDPTLRRLATGLRNGTIALWNFNNGACLRRLRKTDELEIAGVVFCRHRIVTAGWNKHVTTYADQYEDESFRRFKRTHADDITSLVYNKRYSLMATSSYDGFIFVWSLDTEDVIVALNIHKSILPIHLSSKNKKKSNLDVPAKINRHRGSVSDRKKHQAWSARQAVPDVVSTDKDGSVGPETNALVDRWLPSYLPWVTSPSSVASGDSDSADDAASDLTSCASRSSRMLAHPEHIHSDHVVHKIVFLQGRNSNENTAVLLAAVAQGLVVAWSVHQKGGVLGYFEATQAKSEAVLSMDSDDESERLVTGDSRGYVKLWDITSYCNGREVQERREALEAADTNILHDNDVGCFTDGHFTHPTYIPLDEPPKLLWAIRAHLKPVTSVVYVKERDLVVTGSSDCSVRLWSGGGRYIGTFGQKQTWNLQYPVMDKDLPVNIPEDVRRVGSTTTLRVIKGGVHPQWKQVQHAVNFMAKARGFPLMARKKSAAAHEVESEIREQFDQVNKSLLKEKGLRPGVRDARRESVTVWMDDSPHAIVRNARSKEADDTYHRVMSTGVTSDILGKINYKPKKRHKESKVDRNIKWSETHPIVYNALPCFELDTPAEPKMPEYLRKRGALAKHATTIIAHQRAIGLFRPKTSPIDPRKTASPLNKRLSPSPSGLIGPRMSREWSRVSACSVNRDDIATPRVRWDLRRASTSSSIPSSVRIQDPVTPL